MLGNAFKVIGTPLTLPMIYIEEESNCMTQSMHLVIYNFILFATALGIIVIAGSVSIIQLFTTQPYNLRDR